MRDAKAESNSRVTAGKSYGGSKNERPELIATRKNTVSVYFYDAMVGFNHVKLKTYGATSHYPNGVTIDIHPKYVEGFAGTVQTVCKADDDGEPSAIINLHGIDVVRLERLWRSIESHQTGRFNILTKNAAIMVDMLLSSGGFYEFYDNVQNDIQLPDIYKLVANSATVTVTTMAAIGMLYVGIDKTDTLVKALNAGGYADAFVELPKNVHAIVNQFVKTPTMLQQKLELALEHQSDFKIVEADGFHPDAPKMQSSSCCIL